MFLEDNTVVIGICSENTLFVFQIAVLVIRIIQILVPFALIIWGSIDFFKALISGDEKEMKQKRKPFISRVVAALVILLMPMLVNLIIQTIAKNYPSTNSFTTCWSDAIDNIGKITIPGSDSDVK